MAYKGAVASTHCMPLALNLQPENEYTFGVEVHKLYKETKKFSSFLKREVTFAPVLLYYEPRVLASNEIQPAHHKHDSLVAPNIQGCQINNGLAFSSSAYIFPQINSSSGSFPLTPVLSASSFFERQPLASTGNVAPYNAFLEVIPSDLRKVTLQLTF